MIGFLLSGGYGSIRGLINMWMKVFLFFKTSRRNYQTIRRNNTEELAPQYECKFVTKKSFSAVTDSTAASFPRNPKPYLSL